MKSKNYYLIFIVTGILCLSAPGQIEFERSEDELLLIDKPCPTLAGIDELHVVVLCAENEPNTDGLNWAQLKNKVTGKLDEAGIKQIDAITGNIINIDELRICVNLLKLEDTQQYAFFIQTAIVRAVRLKDMQDPVFKANVWQAAPALRAVSLEGMPDAVVKVVLEQVDVFVHARLAANSYDNLLTETQKMKTDLSSQSQAAAGKYVASKNSSVFHKPDCRSAKNISRDNLVVYNNRDEAIKAGKRPCKSCNP